LAILLLLDNTLLGVKKVLRQLVIIPRALLPHIYRLPSANAILLGLPIPSIERLAAVFYLLPLPYKQ
jgi:hypothetical protein